MAFEQNYQESLPQFESGGDISLKQKWKPIAAPTSSSENANGCFDCNICLDSAHDPVVTFCGHLYCWPCIYKWLHVQSLSVSDAAPKCPICKANISESSLVPLYGRGSSPSDPDVKSSQLDLTIPARPPAHGAQTLVTAATSMTSNPDRQLHSYPFRTIPQPFHPQYFPHPHGNYTSLASPNFGGPAMTNLFSPTVGVFGGMAFPRIFGSSETSLFTYPYSNAYPFMGGSPRMRRQEMQLDKSLNRVTIFLFCCFILCLILF